MAVSGLTGLRNASPEQNKACFKKQAGAGAKTILARTGVAVGASLGMAGIAKNSDKVTGLIDKFAKTGIGQKIKTPVKNSVTKFGEFLKQVGSAVKKNPKLALALGTVTALASAAIYTIDVLGAKKQGEIQGKWQGIADSGHQG